MWVQVVGFAAKTAMTFSFGVGSGHFKVIETLVKKFVQDVMTEQKKSADLKTVLREEMSKSGNWVLL